MAATTTTAPLADTEEIYALVQDRYGSYARQHEDESYNQKVAKAFGYSAEELESVPKGANLGVSCGNPTAMAGLGETVIDLGCGAGFDVFLAAKAVAPDGMAIGVDMNKDMLALAERNARTSLYSRNATFVESVITSIPSLADNTANCIISNCVINLVPHAHKHLVFEEIWRLLKPGGRVAVSDIVAKKKLSESIRTNLSLYVGCVAGASLVEDYEGWLKGVGFKDIVIVDTHSDVNTYKTSGEGIADQCGTASSTKATGCCQPLNTNASNSDASACCASDSSCGPQEKAKDTAAKCGTASSTKAIGCCQPQNTPVPKSDASSCCASGSSCGPQEEDDDVKDIDLNEWVGSYKIYAIKPNN